MMAGNIIFLVDMQSFYAAIEKADNPALEAKPVIVSGDPERRSGVVLAACPLAKKSGVKNAERLWEAQKKCPEAVIVKPRMQRYLDVALQITDILERFTDLVEVFSIDEQFMDVTASQRLFGDPIAMAKRLQRRIYEETRVVARVGIGPNKILAKTACDHFAKKSTEGIFYLDAASMKTEMWELPIGAMFGVGHRMEKHLHRMGIRKIGHLAKFPLQKLQHRWGINGTVLWRTANGMDDSPVTVTTYDRQKAIGHHMTLPKDYKSLQDIKVVLLELSEEVAYRSRLKDYVGNTVSVGVRGANFNLPTGFNRQLKLPAPTNDGLNIFRAAYQLFQKHWDHLPIRSVGINLSQLQRADHYQLSLFEPRVKTEHLNRALDVIYAKYGRAAIVRAASLTEAGQAFHRAEKIGGHYR